MASPAVFQSLLSQALGSALSAALVHWYQALHRCSYHPFVQILAVAFNDLRLCCPVALTEEVTITLQDALEKVVKSILTFHRAEDAAFSPQERELFIQFCTVFLEDLTPYLNRCLQVLFPPAQRAQILGVAPSHLSRYGNLGSINVVPLHEALEGLLPQKEPDIIPTPEAEPEKSQPSIEKAETKMKEDAQIVSAVSELPAGDDAP
ncbi:conserved oligomeric Golgi complex subunit 8-like [Anomaloglossus baeobatrachus]|uniref:conserved oligomeric Golgi complex subunit 8-like n=1 Tax=Anomaloglossus baeobatrachus TaxID=238106 RepID=UPI003F504499